MLKKQWVLLASWVVENKHRVIFLKPEKRVHHLLTLQ
jgi:hypothetical protein